MSQWKDVTDEVSFGNPDDELLPMTKCICGEQWVLWSGPTLSIYDDQPSECFKCKRRFYFRNTVRVFAQEPPK